MLEDEETRPGRDGDAHLVGELEPARAFERLFREEHAHERLELFSILRREVASERRLIEHDPAELRRELCLQDLGTGQASPEGGPRALPPPPPPEHQANLATPPRFGKLTLRGDRSESDPPVPPRGPLPRPPPPRGARPPLEGANGRAMPNYAALLRGVSPMNAKMPALKKAFEAAGFGDVKTVLGSGNVVFASNSKSLPALEKKAEQAMHEELGKAFPHHRPTHRRARGAARQGPVREVRPRAQGQASRDLPPQ